MKPALFLYFDPNTVDEAARLLNQYGAEAKLLAGGQSLVPLMNFRLARPQVLIDLNRVAELDYARSTSDGLHLGAMTRQRALERHPHLPRWNPLLAEAIPLIGHFQIRARGTVGGSIAHADPAAELPAVAVALEAEFLLRGLGGGRVVPAKDFFRGYFTTALEETEVLSEIGIPLWPAGAGWAIEEIARRRGDFALAGAVACLLAPANGICVRARIVLFGVAATPWEAASCERLLEGSTLTDALVAEAAEEAARHLEPPSDIHASSEYRRHLAAVVTKRALSRALARMAKESP